MESLVIFVGGIADISLQVIMMLTVAKFRVLTHLSEASELIFEILHIQGSCQI